MYADVSPVWTITQSVISAAAGLSGVFIGAWMTGRNQKAERRNARIREQLQDFYSPLLGMRAEIKAKGEERLKIDNAAGKLWPQKFAGIRSPDISERISKIEGPRFDKIIEYNNKQLEEVLIPLYIKMLNQFSTHMWLAAPSTLKHYPKLVEYVEMWNRHLTRSIPTEVVEAVGHAEKELYPFYEDLQRNFDRLTKELGIL